MEELINEEIIAIIPIYIENKGNSTVIYTNKSKETIYKSIKTVFKNLCNYYHLDIRQSNNYYKNFVLNKNSIPTPFSGEDIFIQLKVRNPIGKDDGAKGYIRMDSILDYQQKEGFSLIRLENKTELKCLCNIDTIKKQIKNGQIVKTIYREKEKKKESDFKKDRNRPVLYGDFKELDKKVEELIYLIKEGSRS